MKTITEYIPGKLQEAADEIRKENPLRFYRLNHLMQRIEVQVHSKRDAQKMEKFLYALRLQLT